MSAQEFCKEVQKRKSLMITDPITAIGNLIKSKSKAKTTNKQVNQTTVETRMYSKAVSACANRTKVTQRNAIDNSKCLHALGCDMTRMPSGMSPEVQRHWIDSKVKVCKGFSGNVQENRATGVTNDCHASSIVNQLVEAGLTAENVAKIEKVLESKGLATETNSKTNSCSVIQSGVRASSYVEAVSNCLNELGLGQENVMACSSNSKQRNEVGKMYSKCVSDQLSNNTTTATSESKTDVSEKTKLKADTATMSMSASVVIVLVLVAVVMTRSSSRRRGGD
jgi:hypothetical protein